MKSISLAALVASALAVPAFAGNIEPAPVETPIIAPAPPPAPIGVDWTGFYVGGQAGYGFGDVEGTDFDGFLGGLQAGYNYDFGSYVLGAEVDYNFGELDLDGDAGSIDQIGRFKVKAGYDAGRALIYGTAGAAFADADIGGDDLSDIGWTVGAGIDYLVTDNIIAGVEYLYHNFDDFDDSGSDVDANTIAAKVSYRF
ncbi:MAG: outer membrane beta-barrel protein [Pseudomonadota bacterium]